MKNNTQSSKAAFSADGYPELRSHRISACVSPDKGTCLWERRELSLLKAKHPQLQWSHPRKILARLLESIKSQICNIFFGNLKEKQGRKKCSDLCPQWRLVLFLRPMSSNRVPSQQTFLSANSNFLTHFQMSPRTKGY